MDNYGYAQLHDNPIEQMRRSKRITAKTLIGEGRTPFLCLNGNWNHSPDIYDNGLRAQWYLEKGGEFERTAPKDYDFEKWDTIPVPSNWNLQQKNYDLYEGSMWFFRQFQEIPLGDGDRAILRIGAANYACMVFLNHEYLGCHEGGFTPFCVDITDYLRKNNRLLLWVNNTRKPDAVPSDYTDWMNYGGVFRDVYVYRVPKLYITNCFLSYDICKKRIQFEVSLSKQQCEKVKLSIAGLISEEVKTEETGYGLFNFLADPELWFPDNPRLYSYSVICGSDAICGEVGFRTIARQGCQLFLNGKPLFLRGITAHEESLEHGRALTENDCMETLFLAKELNCNFMRLAHYPHTERMAIFADRMGILLWEEIPVYWALDFGNPDTLNNARNQLEELVLRDRNRASVIIWAVGNENPDTDERLSFMKSLIDCARSKDQTRLISAACLIDIEKSTLVDRLAEEVDVIGINEYFGWYYSGYKKLKRLLNTGFDKPVVISEFGAEAVTDFHGTQDEVWSEEYQEKVYRDQFDVLLKDAHIAGLTPWLLFDFKTPRRLNEYQRMYNLKGLVDKSKTKKKQAFYFVQEKYGEICR